MIVLVCGPANNLPRAIDPESISERSSECAQVTKHALIPHERMSRLISGYVRLAYDLALVVEGHCKTAGTSKSRLE